MKKISFITSLLGVLLCGVSSPVAANDCCIAPCAAPCYTNDCDSFCNGTYRLGADYLYWKVQEENLSAGIFNTVAGTETVSHVLNPSFDYKSGFKVNAGYDLPGNEWGVNVEYTHIKANAHVSAETVAGQSITAFTPSAVGALDTLNATWDIHLNQVDVDLSRNLCFGECFKIRPHMGFRTIWWHQTYGVSGRGQSTTAAFNLRQDLKERLNSYGIEGGLWADWNIGSGFSIVGHVGGSVLYSKFTLSETESVNDFSSNTLLGQETLRNSIHTGTPTFDYFVGLQYADCVCETYIAARLGWEQRVILNANQFSRGHGNLSAAGLTAGLDVAF